jgi:hypothetical protein
MERGEQKREEWRQQEFHEDGSGFPIRTRGTAGCFMEMLEIFS